MRNGSRPPAEPSNDDALERDLEFTGEGEVVFMPEHLVVAPVHGRFRREPLVEGAKVEAGARIGAVAYNGGAPREVCSPVAGVFLGWLAWEGEHLVRGAMLARIGPAESVNGNGNGHAARNGKRKAKR